jgi:Leucine-rich repeat (LRR) protein
MRSIFVMMIFVAMVTVMCLEAQGTAVYFADANLKAEVIEELGVTDPTEADMLGLTYLAANHQGIVDLTGLEYATNLERLYLSSNQISDISALSDLTSLTTLYLYSNQISDISSLSGLTNLTALYLYSNQISDISSLSGLTNLTALYLYSNQISDISSLSSLTNLTYLDLHSNQINDISALSGLTNLTNLRLSSNQISDINALVDNPGFGSGDYISLWDDPLSSEAVDYDIATLRGRGVTVAFDTTIAPPAPAINPDPRNGDNKVPIIITLSWEDCVRADTVDLYFWNANGVKPASSTVSGCTENSCDISGLEFNTTYSWQVVSINANGSTYSDTWSFTTSNSPFVYFADENLKAAIEAELGVTDPTEIEMLGLTYLAANYQGIIDLTGIEYALNLTYLYLDSNQVSDISALLGLTNITSLGLSYNPLGEQAVYYDIPALEGKGVTVYFDPATAPPARAINPDPGYGDTDVPIIITLSWEDCIRANTMDVYLWDSSSARPTSPTVAGCTENSCVISGLDLNTTYNWQVVSINANGETYGDTWSFTTWVNYPLVYFADANLKTAVEEELGVTDPMAPDMLGLTYLDAGNMEIVDLTGLEHALNLVTLYLSSNQISDISLLSGLEHLTTLNLHFNQINDISYLSSLTNLTVLNLFANQVSDIDSLVNNPGFGSGDYIYLQANPLNGQAVYYDIPTLQSRGATVYYDVSVWVDTDGDNIPDIWEEIYDEVSEVTDTGVLPLDPAIDAANTDNDSDGKSNIDEFNANTDPTSAADLFEIYSIECVTGDSSDTVTVQWYIKLGMDYQLYSTQSLETPSWTPVPGAYTDYGDTASQVDVITPPGTKRYYKVEVW